MTRPIGRATCCHPVSTVGGEEHAIAVFISEETIGAGDTRDTTCQSSVGQYLRHNFDGGTEGKYTKLCKLIDYSSHHDWHAANLVNILQEFGLPHSKSKYLARDRECTASKLL